MNEEQLRARVAELESRLAEIEAQEPVATKGSRETCRAESPADADVLWHAVVPNGTKLYARPVPAHLYCPNCYCKCCQHETWSKAE